MEEYKLNWSGMLTTENIEQVVKLLEKLLTGKRYTFVTCNEFFGFKPKVWTSQELKDTKPFSVWHGDDNYTYAGFYINDSYGVWGCSTNLTDENKQDNTYQNPYIVFERDKVTITRLDPSGRLTYWCAAVEQG